MAAANEHVVLIDQPDKLVLLAEIPAGDSCDPEPTVTFRLLVEQSYGYGADAEDDDTMEDVTCRVPLRDCLGCADATVDRAFGELVARLDNPTLRAEVAPEVGKAAARVRARCGGRDAAGELGKGVEFRLRVTLIDAISEEPASDQEEDYESGSDMEFGEFDLGGARKLHVDQFAAAYGFGYEDDDDDDYGYGYGYENDDDDDDGCGAQFSARPYHGALAREGGPSDGTLLLSDFEARSDGPEITEQHELTSWDVQHLVRLALDGGGSVEDDEAYQRALSAGGGTPVSLASRAAILDQALQSARQQQQQSKSPSPMFPMRTGF